MLWCVTFVFTIVLQCVALIWLCRKVKQIDAKNSKKGACPAAARGAQERSQASVMDGRVAFGL